jgi:outer membrane protein assembly factor BamB
MTWLRSVPLLLVCALPAGAADWPQWLGPKRDGSSTEKVKPWKGNLKVLWSKPAGPGHSSPVVAGGKVFLHTQVKDKEEEAVTAYDAKSGKLLWTKAYKREKFRSPFGTGPQATPAVAGGKVYSFGATGVLACFDADKGELKWKVDTLEKFAAKNLFFGMSCSPLVEGDKVIVNVGGKGAAVVAFKKDSGEVAWKALDDRASYSSGIAYTQAGKRQVVFLTQQGLRSLDPSDGSVYWKVPLVDKLNESSTTPVRAGEVLLGSSVTFGSLALELNKKDDKPAVKQLWKEPKLTCYFSTPIPVGGDVFMVTGTVSFFKKPSSTLRCVELKSGKVRWSKEKIGAYHAAMLRTGDNKLLLLSDLGQLILLDPSPKEYKELARSKVSKGKAEQIWAHPALANGRVYLRDEKELICLQLP